MLKLTAIGHLGKDAVVNQVSGKQVINFNLAHSEKWESNGEKKEKTVWLNCSYWVEKTGIAPYLKKGTQIYVEGQPDIRTYETKEGKHGASLELRVFQIQLLGGKREEADGTQPTGDSNPAPKQQPVEDDAMPF